MTLTSESLLLFIVHVSGQVVLSKSSPSEKQLYKESKYSEHDSSYEWQPNKFQIQDRFHPVVNHHVKLVPGKQNQISSLKSVPVKQFSQFQSINNQNVQPIFFAANNENIGNDFKSVNEISSADIFQFDQTPESHDGEILPGLVNQISFQKQNENYGNQNLDFPSLNPAKGPEYIEFNQQISETLSPSFENRITTSTMKTENPNNITELKTIYVPWIFIPPSSKFKIGTDHYQDEKSMDIGYSSSPPKPTYLPPEPSYLPPEPTYLPPPELTYLPPKPSYLPPEKPTYLPPEPMGYPPSDSYYYPKPLPAPPLPLEEEKEKAAEFTYFFLGRKLWYIPLYFSIYFVLYVGYLVLKAIARHKVRFPQLLHNAAVVSARTILTTDGHYDWMKQFLEMEDLAQIVYNALDKFQRHC